MPGYGNFPAHENRRQYEIWIKVGSVFGQTYKYKGLSEILGCKEQTIRNKLSLGIFPIPTYKVVGRLEWKSLEVQNYLNKLERVN